ncbi:MAG: hypothetical protein IJC94_08715 [Oscillospiraceae bacterium]|nr:hypothetical protein [Oscillospiraceae bacterium]MBQ9937917.1 hypothetical protein [Oscillospiraceae bacterium]
MKTVDGTSLSDFSRKILLVVAIIIVLAAIAVSAVAMVSAGEKLPEGYDPAGRVGMLFGEKYVGEKNDATVLSYRINSTMEFNNGSAKGAVMIENPAKNVIDLSVKLIYKNGESEYLVYESGLLPPNSHIMFDKLDTALSAGEYTSYAVITGFDPQTGEELGNIKCDVNIVVNK